MLAACLLFLGLFVWVCVVSIADGDFRGEVGTAYRVPLPSGGVPRWRLYPFAPSRSVCAPCIRLVYMLQNGVVPCLPVGLPYECSIVLLSLTGPLLVYRGSILPGSRRFGLDFCLRVRFVSFLVFFLWVGFGSHWGE
jgi:hypothetical protein